MRSAVEWHRVYSEPKADFDLSIGGHFERGIAGIWFRIGTARWLLVIRDRRVYPDGNDGNPVL